METTWLLQFGVTLRRNFFIKIRDGSQTFQEIFLPAYIVALLILVKLIQPEKDIAATPWQSEVDALCQPLISDTHGVCRSLIKRNPLETMLAYVPQGNVLTDKFVQQTAQLFADEYGTPVLVPQSFRTEDELISYYRSHPEKVYAAIVFEGIENSNEFPEELKCRIRVNGTYVPSAQQSRSHKEECRLGGSKCPANNYLSSGFIALQSIMSQVALRIALPNDSCSHKNFTKSTFARQQPLPAYHLSFASLTFQFFTSMYMVWAFVPQLQTVLHNIVKEKEELIKDCMLVMGLRETVYWISWFVMYALMSALTSIVLVLMVRFSKLFVASDMKVLFLIFYSFSLSLISLAFSLSAFFSKVRTAISVSAALMILGSFIIIPVEFLDWTPATCLWLSLFSPVGLALAVNVIVLSEGSGKGVTMENIWSTSIGTDQVDGGSRLSVGIIICILVFDCVAYILIAWYLDNIWPHPERGSKKPWNYIFSKKYWFKKRINVLSYDDVTSYSQELNVEINVSPVDTSKEVHERSNDNNLANVEDVDPSLASKVAVEIQNLRKVYNTSKKWWGIWSFDNSLSSDTRFQRRTEALKGLNLKIYEGEKFAITGHSGSGKSSIIYILSSLSRCSSGNAFIHGHSVTTEDVELKSIISVCPKGNICSGLLSPREELEYFSAIKGKPWEGSSNEGKHVSARIQIDEFLKELNLLEDADKRANYLTPQAKRKLSLAIALIGHPKVVVIDEPTSGLDLCSKSQFWSLISKIDKKFVLIFTTDSMEEADLMADRKAVLSHGILKCCGSSVFLRKCFGLHYLLHITRGENYNSEKVLELVQTHICDAVPVPTPRGQAHSTFKIPLECSSQMNSLIMELTLNAAELGIEGGDLEATTLEEIFMKFQDEAEDEASSLEHLYGKIRVDETATESEALLGNRSSRIVNSERSLIMMQILALLSTRFKLYWRNSIATITTFSLPLVLVLIVLFAQHFLGKSDPKVMNLFDNSIGQNIPLYYTVDNQKMQGDAHSLLDIFGTNHILLDDSSLIKRFDVSGYPIPSTVNAIGISVHELNVPNCSFKYTIDYQPWHIHQLPTVSMMLDNAFLQLVQKNFSQSPVAKMHIANHPLPYGEADTGTGLLVVFFFSMGVLLIPPILASQVVYEKQSGIFGVFKVSGMRSVTYWMACYITDITLLYVSSFITVATSSLFDYSPFMKDVIPVTVLLLVLVLPAVLLFSYIFTFLLSNAQSALQALSILFVLFAGVPYFFVLLPSGEISSFAWHVAFAIVDPPYTLLSSLHLIVMSVERLKGENGFLPSSISNALYFFKWDTHVTLCMLCAIISTLILFICLWRMESYKLNSELRDTQPENVEESQSTEEVQENNDIELEKEKILASISALTDFNDAEDFQDLSRDLLICYGLGKKLSTSGGACSPKADNETSSALKNIWLAVEEGEVLVLLGGEKAGKSTLLNCLARQTRITSGDAYICGNSIRYSFWPQTNTIGFCTQHELMYQSLTMREHLYLFAALKGLINYDMAVGTSLDALQLMGDADKRIRYCKASSHRKLAFATAILGDPAVLLLDEPTYGLDTISKQKVWRQIAGQPTTHATLICTQSFEEAEAIGKRVGILVDGRLKCLASPQELKRRYGSEYSLLIIAQRDKMPTISEFISSLLPRSQEEIHHYDNYNHSSPQAGNLIQKRFQVPVRNLSELAMLLHELEVKRHVFGIKDYVINQPTLQQVFHRISQVTNVNNSS